VASGQRSQARSPGHQFGALFAHQNGKPLFGAAEPVPAGRPPALAGKPRVVGVGVGLMPPVAGLNGSAVVWVGLGFTVVVCRSGFFVVTVGAGLVVATFVSGAGEGATSGAGVGAGAGVGGGGVAAAAGAGVGVVAAAASVGAAAGFAGEDCLFITTNAAAPPPSTRSASTAAEQR